MKKKLYLTFDMEWANDEILEWFYKFVCGYEIDIPFTIFVTRETKWIEIFRKDNRIELGIHPNFNHLLNGDASDVNYLEVMRRLKLLVPEAEAYRSHSMTVNSMILSACMELGIKKDLNMIIRPHEGDVLNSFIRSGVEIVPFIWEDDLWLCDEKKQDLDFLLGDSFVMPRIFNFHPIQLYLNCEKIERYNAAKKYNWDIEKLSQFRNERVDILCVRKFFDDLVIKSLEYGYEFDKIGNL